jgi:hypothetical protein
MGVLRRQWRARHVASLTGEFGDTAKRSAFTDKLLPAHWFEHRRLVLPGAR